MARKQASSGSASRSRGGRRSSRRSRSRTWLRRGAWLCLVAGFAGGFGVGVHVVRLDREVRHRFEGRLFQVPSRVLSAPTILYPGLDWKVAGVRDTLRRLGYREESPRKLAVTTRLDPGEYVWARGRVRIHLRGFDHPSRAEPPRDIVLRLRGDAIDEIRDVSTRHELGAVLLEPETVGSYYGPAREQRELVSLDQVPGYLVDAVVAVEDQRFESHHGIDPRRIVGAFLANLRAGGIRQGGSTLTQQLAKNFFLTPERTLRRKLDEALIALILEARYDKAEILEAYLNEIYLGQRGSTAVHGVGEAARLYFGKSAARLTLAESALIAAIIQSPNATSPFRHPEKAVARRNLVLDLMYRQGRIEAGAYREAKAEGLALASNRGEMHEARYFLDALRRQLPEVYDSEVLTAEGLRIYSTLDFRLQRIASRTVVEGLADLEKRYPELKRDDKSQQLQACLVALRPQTGEVLALVGGRSYSVSQFDRCTQAQRQAGSIFKPFVYIAALEPDHGSPFITLAGHLEDTPLRVDTPTGPWEPENFDRQFHGEVSVREALERSLNVATARLAGAVGIDKVAEVARRLGIESPLPLVPSLALGAADVSPMEMARAYATLANGGVRPEIRTFEDVVDAQGHTQARRDIEFKRVLDPGTAYLAVSLLQGVIERGTAWSVRRTGLTGPLAGKTGTSDDERDAWFVGFTPELVVAVWVGFDEPQSLGLASSRIAVPLWSRFVYEATGGWVRGSFPRPPEVVELDIEPTTGAVALAGCPVSRPELFLAGTEPTQTCPEGMADGDHRRPGRKGGGLLQWLRDVL